MPVTIGQTINYPRYDFLYFPARLALCDNLYVHKLSQSVGFLSNMLPKTHAYGKVSHQDSHIYMYTSNCYYMHVSNKTQKPKCKIQNANTKYANTTSEGDRKQNLQRYDWF